MRLGLRRFAASGWIALIAASCGPTEDSAPVHPDEGLWALARWDRDDSEERVSFGEVSRPSWSPPLLEGIELRDHVPAVVEIEIHDPLQTAEPVLRWADQRWPMQQIGPDDETWTRYRATVAQCSFGRATLSLEGAEEAVATMPLRWTPSAVRRPNVVWVSIDTLRADFLGCYGHDRETTPHLDRWAARGTRFERVLAPSAWTLPSLVTALTSSMPHEHGVVHVDRALSAAATTLPERLGAAGWTTAAFVGGTFTDSTWGFDQGFDRYDDLGMVVSDADRTVDPTDLSKMDEGAHRRITSQELTDKAIAWLRDHRNRRFFLWVHYFDPHADYLAHAGTSERFPARELPAERHSMLDPEPERTRAERALYEGEIAFTEAHVDRLLEELHDSGLLEHTVVVLFSDHGEEFFERMGRGHGHSLFDEVLRVPMLWIAPGRIPAGAVRPHAGLEDLVPTLLDLCGLPTSDELAGDALFSEAARELDAPSAIELRGLYYSAPTSAQDERRLVGLRVDAEGYTLLQDHRGGRTRTVLVDENDGPQRRNLSGSQPERLRRLLQASQALRQFDAAAELHRPLELAADTRARLEALGYTEDGPDDAQR